MFTGHPIPSEPTRTITLTEDECIQIRRALKSRHLMIVDDMWDTASRARVQQAIDAMHAIVSAVSKLWATPASRVEAYDESHVLQDETAHQISERLKSLDTPDLGM